MLLVKLEWHPSLAIPIDTTTAAYTLLHTLSHTRLVCLPPNHAPNPSITQIGILPPILIPDTHVPEPLVLVRAECYAAH